ncbi:MAG: undecaprenyl-diphosphate phosphatase [Desulfuromonadaceae bacterium]|nr:undecaprenyl-diphosphate phosphatase [Desulfuromonadaceae bacterium]
MTMLQSIFLGLLQGLTEFLPVSSSGHLAIAQHFIADFEQPGILFDVILHFGTLIAVMLYFSNDIKNLCFAPWNKSAQGKQYRKLLLLIIFGSIPTAIIGLTFKDTFTAMFHNIYAVASMLLITGTLLFTAQRWRHGKRPMESITFTDAFITGVAQSLAIAPGISRSGSTIAALLFRGIDGASAARFSFLLSLPAIAGATLLSVGDMQSLPTDQIPVYLAGGAMAFISGLAAIHMLLRILARKRLSIFALYCWAVACAVFVLS